VSDQDHVPPGTDVLIQIAEEAQERVVDVAELLAPAVVLEALGLLAFLG